MSEFEWFTVEATDPNSSKKLFVTEDLDWMEEFSNSSFVKKDDARRAIRDAKDNGYTDLVVTKIVREQTLPEIEVERLRYEQLVDDAGLTPENLELIKKFNS